jgi:ubiquinone/menaquinone biosynthesis C-methylase UbiE
MISIIEKEKEYHNKRFAKEVRMSAHKFYAIESESRNRFKILINTNVKGQKILELGCGKGSYAFELAKIKANISGIDISEVAIEYSENKAKELKLVENTDFQVMNAEELDFEDARFDRLFGSSILHHLDLNKSISELARVLASNGEAIFIEPLGHNVFINLYRKLTPNYRTEDEHPFVVDDFKILKNSFDNVEIEYFHLVTLFAVPFRNFRAFNTILKIFQNIDRLLFKLFPFIRKQAWQIVITASEPKRRS